MYTSGGKKVAVIRKLNAEDSIVREIYMDEEEKEIQHGEPFVVKTKTLSEDRYVTWQEKEVQKWKVLYDQEYKLHEKRMQELRDKQKVVGLTLSALRPTITLTTAMDAFDRMVDLLTGKYRWMLSVSYYPRLEELDEKTLIDRGYHGDVQGLRLVSLFGKSDGDLTWGINRYSDGSGSWETVDFFETKEEALREAAAYINGKEKINQYDVDFMEKWGMVIAPEKLAAYYESVLQGARSRVQQATKDLEKLTAELRNLERRVNP